MNKTIVLILLTAFLLPVGYSFSQDKHEMKTDTLKNSSVRSNIKDSLVFDFTPLTAPHRKADHTWLGIGIGAIGGLAIGLVFAASGVIPHHSSGIGGDWEYFWGSLLVLPGAIIGGIIGGNL